MLGVGWDFAGLGVFSFQVILGFWGFRPLGDLRGRGGLQYKSSGFWGFGFRAYRVLGFRA